MKEPFLPSLSLEKIYVTPLVPQEDGTYRCLSFDEMQQVTMPQTGCALMDAVARTLATVPCRKGIEVADHLDVDLRKLSGAVDLYFGIGLNELVIAYRTCLASELVRLTQLSPEEVAKRCGLASTSTLMHLIKSQLNTTFFDLRKQSQQEVQKTFVVYK